MFRDFSIFRNSRKMRGFQGFTLIELLIVIAIILILIAIALPNFLEAQIRARVTKSQAELRSLWVAFESYQIDWGVYPNRTEQDFYQQPIRDRGMLRLTSPVAYIKELPRDPFAPKDLAVDTIQTYEAGGIVTRRAFPPQFTINHVVWGRGPEGETEQYWHNENPHYDIRRGGRAFSYAATNGSKSAGALFICMGDGRWFGVRSDIDDPAALKDPSKQEPYIVNNIDYHGRLPPHSWGQ